MAKLDDLIEQVTDGALRTELSQAVRDLRRRGELPPIGDASSVGGPELGASSASYGEL